jgi:hypothetical protein
MRHHHGWFLFFWLGVFLAAIWVPSAVFAGGEVNPWSVELRALVIVVDPRLPSCEDRTLTEQYRWNPPARLAEEFIRDVETATHGQVRFSVAETIEDHDWPPFLDGATPYSDETFRQDWEKDRTFAGKCDYVALLEKHGVREKVESGQIDEVWLFGFPGMGCFETCMAGAGAIWCNGPVIQPFTCSRSFVVYGFNYERGVDCMLEDLGHRVESVMAHVFRNDPPDSPWSRFTQYDKTHPGEAGCGNVHFAPNSQRDYEWGNPTPVPSTCEDWAKNFPDLTGSKTTVACDEWGGGDMRLHHLWWFSHLPHHPGTAEGKLLNWWKYVFAWNTYKDS